METISKHVKFQATTYRLLEEYIRRRYNGFRVLSMVVDKAVKEFLEREANK